MMAFLRFLNHSFLPFPRFSLRFLVISCMRALSVFLLSWHGFTVSCLSPGMMDMEIGEERGLGIVYEAFGMAMDG